MATEDASSVLAEFVSSLDNLPHEIGHIVAELGSKEMLLTELRNKVESRESSIARHHKTAGLLAVNPKEASAVAKNRADLQRMTQLADDKVRLAERAVSILRRHAMRFEKELTKVNGGVLPVLPAAPSAPATPLAPISPYQAVHSALRHATESSQAAVSYAPPYVTSASDRSMKRKNPPTLNSPLATPYNAPAPPQSAVPSPIATPQLAMISQHAQLSARPQRPSRLSTSFGHGSAHSPSGSDVESGGRPSADLTRNPTAMDPGLKRSHKRQRPNTATSQQPPLSASFRRAATEADEDEDAEGEDDEGEDASFENGDFSGGGGDDGTLYCYCRKVSYGQMVGCDNTACPREWFHFECVGLKSQPAGAWYCRDCIDAATNSERRRMRK